MTREDEIATAAGHVGSAAFLLAACQQRGLLESLIVVRIAGSSKVYDLTNSPQVAAELAELAWSELAPKGGEA